MDHVVTKILTNWQLCPEQNFIVGVSGIDGSGKSTLAGQVEEILMRRGIPTTQINVDDFLHPKSVRHRNSDPVQGYFEDNFDFDSLVAGVLEPVQQKMEVTSEYPVLDLDTDQISKCRFEFRGPGVVIVEGVFLFRKELRDHFDLKVWIDISFENAMLRILQRPRDRRYGDIGAIRSRYETRFFPGQRFHLERDDPVQAADLTVTST